jgi:hypothetical protein
MPFGIEVSFRLLPPIVVAQHLTVSLHKEAPSFAFFVEQASKAQTFWCLRRLKRSNFFEVVKGDEVLSPPPPSLVARKNYRLAVKAAVSNPAPAILSRLRLAPAKNVYNSSDE